MQRYFISGDFVQFVFVTCQLVQKRSEEIIERNERCTVRERKQSCDLTRYRSYTFNHVRCVNYIYSCIKFPGVYVCQKLLTVEKCDKMKGTHANQAEFNKEKLPDAYIQCYYVSVFCLPRNALQCICAVLRSHVVCPSVRPSVCNVGDL